jgi:hypothetical protein
VVVVGLVAALVGGGLAGTPAGAAVTPATAAPALTAASDEALRSGPRAEQALAAGLVGDRPVRTPSATRSARITAGYADTCHDAGGSPLDLRELAVTDETDTQQFVLTITSCTTWSASDLGPDGFLEVPLSVARTDGPDHLVLVTPSGASGLRLTVLETPTDDPGTWRTTHESTMTRPDGFTAEGTFPHGAIDDPSEFVFIARSVDAEGREDLLPEEYADALAYPFSCSLTVQRAATLVVDPASAGRLAGLARERGAAVRGAGSAVLALDDVSDATLQALRRAPGVRSAERAVVYRRAAVPDDPAYPQQWHLPALEAPRAWDVRAASGLLLAVVDDGVDGLRPELAEKVVAGGRDTVYDQPLPADSDLGGHGTAVSGLAAAQTNNAFEVAAVDWGASVLPLRVFDAAGCATDGAVATALYAAADAGASVANLSLGGPGESAALERAVDDVTARGVLVVAASGNSRETDSAPNYPAAYAPVLAVGATGRNGQLAVYSSGGEHVDITAPGGDGNAAAPENDLLVLAERGGLDRQAGTSFAAPLVSASALLLRAGNPELTPAQVIAAIERSAVDAGPAGRDPDYGAGRLDLAALLGTPTSARGRRPAPARPGRSPRTASPTCPRSPSTRRTSTASCGGRSRQAAQRLRAAEEREPGADVQLPRPPHRAHRWRAAGQPAGRLPGRRRQRPRAAHQPARRPRHRRRSRQRRVRARGARQPRADGHLPRARLRAAQRPGAAGRGRLLRRRRRDRPRAEDQPGGGSRLHRRPVRRGLRARPRRTPRRHGDVPRAGARPPRRGRTHDAPRLVTAAPASAWAPHQRRR